MLKPARWRNRCVASALLSANHQRIDLMSRTVMFAIAISAIAMGTDLSADQKNKPEKNKGKSKQSTSFCPPGLAKKNLACVPPGKAKKRVGAVIPAPGAVLDWPILGVGDPHPKDVITIFDPDQYVDDPDAVFVRFGDNIYRLRRSDGTVLDWVGEGWNWDGDWADLQSCPPGLAKKDPPCVPPGQAKKGVTAANAADRFGVGDRLPDGYEVIIDPRLYEPGSNTRYVRYGDSIYRVDQDTGIVLDVIGLVSDFVN